MNYKKKIEEEVRKSFEPLPYLAKFGKGTCDQDVIERVKLKHIAEAIDEHERKHKIGKYKPKPKGRK